MRDDGLEGRGSSHRCQPLGRSVVGDAEHSHVTVAPGLFCAPFYSVVAILYFVPIGVELAFGGVATANILDHDGIIAGHGPNGVQVESVVPGYVLAIGDSGEEHGMLAAAAWPEDIGVKGDAVPHSHGHVGLDTHRGAVVILVFPRLGQHLFSPRQLRRLVRLYTKPRFKDVLQLVISMVI